MRGGKVLTRLETKVTLVHAKNIHVGNVFVIATVVVVKRSGVVVVAEKRGGIRAA